MRIKFIITLVLWLVNGYGVFFFNDTGYTGKLVKIYKNALINIITINKTGVKQFRCNKWIANKSITIFRLKANDKFFRFKYVSRIITFTLKLDIFFILYIKRFINLLMNNVKYDIRLDCSSRGIIPVLFILSRRELYYVSYQFKQKYFINLFVFISR